MLSTTVQDGDDLVLASAYNDLRTDILISWPHLYNRSGETLSPGTLVIVDSAHDESYITTTNEDEDLVIGIVKEETANNVRGYLWPIGGIADINVNEAVTRGHFLASSTTAGRAKDIGIALTLGTIGTALESFAGPGDGTIKARVILGKTARHDSLMGMMTMIESSCPAQWTRFATADDKFIKAGTTYGGTSGTTNHHHEYSEIPLHTHTHSESLDSGGNNSHGRGSLSVNSAGSHGHSYRRTLGSGDDVISAAGFVCNQSGNTGSAGTHQHNSCTGHTVSSGLHAHSISLTIDNAGTAGTHNTTTVNNIPPYLEMVICEKTTDDEI